MPNLGRYQRAYFDDLTVAEAVVEIQKFEKELLQLIAPSQASFERRAELEARITYLRDERLGGRTYERFDSIGQVHATDCPVARAITGAVAIECEHGHDVCPQCDVCDCAGGKKPRG